MIKIDDRIVSYFDILSRDDYRTLIIVSRYMTEGPVVHYSKLVQFWISEPMMLGSINSLAARLDWKFYVTKDTGEWLIHDTHLDRTLKVEFRDFTSDCESPKSTINELTVLPPKGGNMENVSIGGNGEAESEGKSLLGPQSLINSLHKLIYSQRTATLATLTNLVEYFLAKKRAIDPLLVIDKKERGRNFGNIKYLTGKYPDIDEATWKRAIDFFFNDSFWAQHFTSLIFLDKHLQNFFLNKPRRPSTRYKVVS